MDLALISNSEKNIVSNIQINNLNPSFLQFADKVSHHQVSKMLSTL